MRKSPVETASDDLWLEGSHLIDLSKATVLVPLVRPTRCLTACDMCGALTIGRVG